PPGALVATDQERGFTVFPALVDVGTTRLFTHRVQTFAAHQALEFGELRTHPHPRLDPRRLLLDRRLTVANLETQQLPALGLGAHQDTSAYSGCFAARASTRSRSFCRRASSKSGFSASAITSATSAKSSAWKPRVA